MENKHKTWNENHHKLSDTNLKKMLLFYTNKNTKTDVKNSITKQINFAYILWNLFHKFWQILGFKMHTKSANILFASWKGKMTHFVVKKLQKVIQK